MQSTSPSTSAIAGPIGAATEYCYSISRYSATVGQCYSAAIPSIECSPVSNQVHVSVSPSPMYEAVYGAPLSQGRL